MSYQSVSLKFIFTVCLVCALVPSIVYITHGTALLSLVYSRVAQDSNMTHASNVNMVNSTGLCYNSLENERNDQALVSSTVFNMSVPYPDATYNGSEFAQEQWFSDLKQFLLKNVSQGVPISLIVTNYPYITVLLNWLIAARVRVNDGGPVENILVAALDNQTCQLVRAHGLNNICVPLDSMISRERMRMFHKLMVTRMTLARIINYLGFDVIHFDSDATVVKNPLALLEQYRDSDIVGSAGWFPFKVSKIWGFTLCMGFIMFRSTPQTDFFWDMHFKAQYQYNDQKKVNSVLKDLNVTWSGRSPAKRTVHGKGKKNLTVTALPHLQVCRGRKCNKELASNYYVWHKGGVKKSGSKQTTATEANLWYLRNDWRTVQSSSARGDKWLLQLTKNAKTN